MVYRMGIKQYALMCIYGVLLFGFFTTVISGYTLKTGLISGVAFGVLYTFGIALFMSFAERKFAYLRTEISKVRKIVCEGPASHKKGINAIGGWMFLSEDAIEFYAHKLNFGGNNIPILFDDIVEVESKRNKIIIKTYEEQFIFIVCQAKAWEKSIKDIL